MKLNDCTKADLLWLIKRMCQLNLSDRALHTALRDLEYHKEREQTGKAQQQLEIQRAATNRYIEILRAYEGKPISAVPMAVLEEADAALAEARAADRKWRKLMGVKVK